NTRQSPLHRNSNRNLLTHLQAGQLSPRSMPEHNEAVLQQSARRRIRRCDVSDRLALVSYSILDGPNDRGSLHGCPWSRGGLRKKRVAAPLLVHYRSASATREVVTVVPFNAPMSALPMSHSLSDFR
ncbi:MAG: hypothetical protein ACRERX_05585, partial [Pseudomonas sp.]